MLWYIYRSIQFWMQIPVIYFLLFVLNLKIFYRKIAAKFKYFWIYFITNIFSLTKFRAWGIIATDGT